MILVQGAVIGIDDDDDSTFTITVDQKTFHFQGGLLCRFHLDIKMLVIPLLLKPTIWTRKKSGSKLWKT